MNQFGVYDLLALVSRGAMTEVWLARQRGIEGFEKLVVVKRLAERLSREPEYVDMFLDEARINARLQHSNILSVYELGEVDGRYFLSMEYVEGMPLGVLAQKSVERLSDLPIAVAAGLLAQAANGLHYAHEATDTDGTFLHVVHRDLSPLNILVSWDGTVKVADFGIAKADGRRTRTKTGTVKGTPTYMSPEQCSGGLVDRRSDVFALGILLWELLTGRRLFKRDTVEETYDAIVDGAIPPPSTYRLELPSALDALTQRALARRPEDRFETALAFAEELEHALRKDGLAGGVSDVRLFLAQHFEPERVEHEALLAKLRANEPMPSQPLFKRAEHGLDSGPPDRFDSVSVPADVPPPDEIPFDGDTLREATILPPSLPSVKAPTLAISAEEVAERVAETRKRPTWLVALLVLGVLGASLAIGIFAGRSHH